MKKCPDCGSEWMDEVKTCGNCGCPLKNQEAVSDSPAMSDDSTSSGDSVEREGATDENQDETSGGDNPVNRKKFNILLGALAGAAGILLIALIAVSVNGGKLSKTVEDYKGKLKTANSQNEELSQKVTLSEDEYKKLNEDYKKLETNYTQIKTEYDKYKEQMKPFEEMEAAEAKQRKADAEANEKEKENQAIATEAVRKVWNFEKGTLQNGATKDLCAAAKTKINALTDEGVKNALMEAANAAEQTIAAQEQAAAEEAARGYETGITYSQLARTPDDYKNKKVKFYGKVIQVLEGSGMVNLRLAVNDSYDNILYCKYNKNIVGSRVLEDDHITIYGTSNGLYSYEATSGATITIPSVTVESIDQ